MLLPVFAGIAGSDQLFTICCLVVLLSVLLHGSAIAFIIRRPQAPSAYTLGGEGVPVPTGSATPVTAAPVVRAPQPASVSGKDTANGAPAAAESPDRELPERISFEELEQLQRAGEPVILLDVRTARTFEADPFIARGAIRLRPDEAVRLATARAIPWKATLVAYCA